MVVAGVRIPYVNQGLVKRMTLDYDRRERHVLIYPAPPLPFFTAEAEIVHIRDLDNLRIRYIQPLSNQIVINLTHFIESSPELDNAKHGRKLLEPVAEL